MPALRCHREICLSAERPPPAPTGTLGGNPYREPSSDAGFAIQIARDNGDADIHILIDNLAFGRV